MKIVSYWHPNITVNVVYDQNRFVKDKVPPPLDKCKKSRAYHNLLTLYVSLCLCLSPSFQIFNSMSQVWDIYRLSILMTIGILPPNTCQ